jgi:hypothetical protein
MPPQSLSDTHVVRLERLERSARRSRILLLTLLTLAGGLALRPQPVLRAERIELLTASGATQAVISADTGGAYLTLLDARGRAAGAIRLNSEPWLSVRTGDGHEVAGLGAPKVHELGK